MISVCILTKNASSTIAKTLESTRPFPEVLILDNGSTDNTLEIARSFPNTVIHKMPFIGFGPLRNEAARLAKHDWILALDSDEVLSNPEEILSLKLDSDRAYSLPRHNFFNGKQIKGCGWGKEQIARLYNKKKSSYCLSFVHESLLAKNPIPLSFPLLHTPYRTTSEFLAKMQHYSTLFAEQNRHKKNSSISKAILHALFAFLKSYILKRGFLDGGEGFFISLYNANTAFYKYMKLLEANREKIH
jgi:glycosyltransferase involved in cell wall biosynthesis